MEGLFLMNKNTKLLTVFKEYGLYLFLGFILLATVSSMIFYQYERKDPVRIEIKDARGYLTTQIVYKSPNETVGQVVNKAVQDIGEDYICDYDYNQKIKTIDTVNLYEPVSGTISIDGNQIQYQTGVTTVQNILDENGITVSPVDVVTPELTETVSADNSNITVSRVTSSTEVVTEVIPFLSETRENDQLAYNEVRTIQKGQNGVRSFTEEIAYSDGREIERHITSDQRVEPVNEIIEIGTSLEAGKPNIQKGDIASWRPFVIKALEMNGLEPTETRINRVLRQINTESAGDQNAEQEIIDMNTFLGQNAKGLMQTIPSTFEAYHFEGYDDIYNGYHNLLAAINYAKERYGVDLEGLGEGHGY